MEQGSCKLCWVDSGKTNGLENHTFFGFLKHVNKHFFHENYQIQTVEKFGETTAAPSSGGSRVRFPNMETFY